MYWKFFENFLKKDLNIVEFNIIMLIAKDKSGEISNGIVKEYIF